MTTNRYKASNLRLTAMAAASMIGAGLSAVVGPVPRSMNYLPYFATQDRFAHKAHNGGRNRRPRMKPLRASGHQKPIRRWKAHG